jgi:nucleotide-binding universal stress UspA family protein
LHLLAADIGSRCEAVVEPHLVDGDPSIEILAQASQHGASLIVLGARYRSIFEHPTRGRTIYRVLAHARCPVLTLREMDTKVAYAPAKQLAIQS